MQTIPLLAGGTIECLSVRDGQMLIPWATRAFSECVYSNRQAASLIFGIISLLFWIVAQIPQLYTNYVRGSAESLSRLFLATWLMGDATNLLGCILTHQQAFQIRQASYFVSMDVLLLSQYFYLSYRPNRQEEALDDEEVEPLIRKTVRSRSSLAIIVGSALISPVSGIPFFKSDIMPPPPHNYTYELGLFFSWLCAFLYLSSRIPQILLNRSRRSVEGIAIPMFFCAVMGNSTYALSLLLSDEAMMGGHEFWIASLPYLLGSAGTLIFDALIFAQSVMYRDTKQED